MNLKQGKLTYNVGNAFEDTWKALDNVFDNRAAPQENRERTASQVQRQTYVCPYCPTKKGFSGQINLLDHLDSSFHRQNVERHVASERRLGKLGLSGPHIVECCRQMFAACNQDDDRLQTSWADLVGAMTRHGLDPTRTLPFAPPTKSGLRTRSRTDFGTGTSGPSLTEYAGPPPGSGLMSISTTTAQASPPTGASCCLGTESSKAGGSKAADS